MDWLKLLKIELQKILTAPLTYLSGLVMAFLFLCGYDKNADDFYRQMGFLYGWSGFTILAFMCAVIPYGCSYLQEKKTNQYLFTIKRCNTQAYMRSKVCSVYLSGGFVALQGLAYYVGYLLLVKRLPVVEMDAAGLHIDTLIMQHQYIRYWILVVTIFFMLGGIMALVGMAASILLQNGFVAVFAPYILYELARITLFEKLPEMLSFSAIACLLWADHDQFFMDFCVPCIYMLLSSLLMGKGCKILMEYDLGIRSRRWIFRKERGKQLVVQRKLEGERLQEPKRKNKLERVWAIVSYSFRKWGSNPRYIVSVLLLFVILGQIVEGIPQLAERYQVGINFFALLPLICSNDIMFFRTVLGLIFLLLFCDAPFLTQNQLYILTRTGKKSYYLAQVLYILLASGIFTSLVAVLPALYCIRHLAVGRDWGTLFWSASRSDLPFAHLQISYEQLYKYNVLEAFGKQFLLLFFIGIFLGMVIFFFNLLLQNRLGLVIAGGILFLETLPYYFDDLRWVYWVSPFSMANLYKLDVNGLTFYPDFGYAVTFLSVGSIVLIVASYVLFCRRPIQVEEEI